MSEILRVVLETGERIVVELWTPDVKYRVPLVLFGHGLYSDRRSSGKGLALKEAVAREGWIFASLDFYGRGESEGDFRRTTPAKCAACLKAALKTLRLHPSVDASRMCVVGSSFGGLAALLAAAQNDTPHIAALVLIAPALNLCENRKNLRQILPDFHQDFYSATLSEKPFQSAALVKTPTLIIQGDSDELVPPDVAKRLLRVMPDAHLLLLPSVGHSIPQGRPLLTLVEATINFLRKFL